MQPSQPRLTPEIMEALQRRSMGGPGMPAQQQVTAPNPLGGPAGQSQTPLATSPQAVPAGNIPQSMPSSSASAGQASGQQGGGGQQSVPLAAGDKALMKALLNRLLQAS